MPLCLTLYNLFKFKLCFHFFKEDNNNFILNKQEMLNIFFPSNLKQEKYLMKIGNKNFFFSEDNSREILI